MTRHALILALAACAAAFVPLSARRRHATCGLRAPSPSASAATLKSMAEDADDFPSDSVLPDEEPVLSDEEADAPSDVADDAAPNAESVLEAEDAVLERCLGVDRGESASKADREDIARLVADLEQLAPPFDASMLEGTWSLVYSSEPGIYRSSPFFWGFSRLLEGKTSPAPVPGAQDDGLDQGIYAVTDALGPLYTIGDATQTIEGGELVSEVELSLGAAGLPSVGRSVMTSTARYTPTAAGLALDLEKTEVKDSTLASLPGLGFISDLAFPTAAAFDALANALSFTKSAATVQLLATYVSDSVRVTRNEAGWMFVHERSY